MGERATGVLVVVDEEVTLAECPVGLFYNWDRTELCLKTEYGNNEGRIDAFIVSSGEFFWGGCSRPGAQRGVHVWPVRLFPAGEPSDG